MSEQAENLTEDAVIESNETLDNAKNDGYQNDIYNIVMEPGVVPDDLLYGDSDEEPDEPADELPYKENNAVKLDLIKLYNSDEK